MTQLIQDYGLWLLFAVVCLESAGVPLPGETALIAAGVAASQGHLSIEAVIAVAALVSYWLFSRELRRSGLPASATDVALYRLLGGMVGAKLLLVAEHAGEGPFLHLLFRVAA